MSNIKHTPGPWLHNKEFHLYEPDAYSEISAGGFHDPETRSGFAITGMISDADAKLIAAAPELLENLIRIIDRIEENGFQKTFPSAYQRAKAVIKKVTE